MVPNDRLELIEAQLRVNINAIDPSSLDLKRAFTLVADLLADLLIAEGHYTRAGIPSETLEEWEECKKRFHRKAK